MSDIVTWGALVVAAGSMASIIGFWTRYSDRITKAESAASAAADDALEAKRDAQQASEKIIILGTSFGLHREQIAREYIHREVMREFEERLTQSIDRLGDRLDRLLERSERDNRDKRN